MSQVQVLLGELIWPHGQAVKTSPFHGGNTSSNLVGVTFKPNLKPRLMWIWQFCFCRHFAQKPYADMAQLAEQLICNQQVIGSIPIVGS